MCRAVCISGTCFLKLVILASPFFVVVVSPVVVVALVVAALVVAASNANDLVNKQLRAGGGSDWRFEGGRRGLGFSSRCSSCSGDSSACGSSRNGSVKWRLLVTESTRNWYYLYTRLPHTCLHI